MLRKLSKALLGDRQKKHAARLAPFVEGINEEHARLEGLSDEALRSRTQEFRRRLVEGESPDELLCEAFATVKEACGRCLGRTWKVTGHDTEWNMVPFDVQLQGAVVLHEGRIAEMATGEGKTLVAVMPLYLNALQPGEEWISKAKELWGDDSSGWTFEPITQDSRTIPAGSGAHLVTVNDYLARRDSEWMGPVYEFLGLTVGCIQGGMSPAERREQYACDVTYGTNNEFGFDYLRDNMAVRLEDRVQRQHHYAIVDEVDSVLIDEARTPLIISGPVPRSSNRYKEYRDPVARLVGKQRDLVSGIVARADELWERGEEYEAGELYLKARRGAPKHRRLLKSLQDPDRLKALGHVEADRIREKNMHELDEELLFAIDERDRSVSLSDAGRRLLSPEDPDFFLLVDIGETMAELEAMDVEPAEKDRLRKQAYEQHSRRAEALHNIDQLLKAFQIYEKDVEYVVKDGRVMIVDQFTGRLMPGRRFSDGLHEALEAKEKVEIRQETQTLASITIQNYFRMYEKLSGMTGTAETESEEFEDIYGLEVVVIPTNVPVVRRDFDDRVYRTKREKYAAIVGEIEMLHVREQPVLVGTVSVEVSELLSKMLKTRKIPHSVLNAKHHQQEAEIVARAGQPGAVTIATNMAGRGTDIKLSPRVRELPEIPDNEEIPGGLFVLGTERHEARRIDRQLRGRSGRQGDPGASRFYLSLEDDLFRLFASEKVIDFLKKSGAEGETIEHAMLTKAISRAQKRVEQYNYDIRKRLLEYDDVVNRQREVVYRRRLGALTGEGLHEELLETIPAVVDFQLREVIPDESNSEEWDLARVEAQVADLSGTMLRMTDLAVEDVDTPEELRGRVSDRVLGFYREKERRIGGELLGELEKWAMLRAIDLQWREHLYEMDHLRAGIGLRSYGQRDPLVEYKKEAFNMFEELLDNVDKLVVRQVLSLWPQPAALKRAGQAVQGDAHQPTLQRPGEAGPPQPARGQSSRDGAGGTVRRKTPRVGRNDPCPCGSGKKYKKCCGA